MMLLLLMMMITTTTAAAADDDDAGDDVGVKLRGKEREVKLCRPSPNDSIM